MKLFLLGAVAFASAALAADPVLLGLVMPNATIVGGVQLDQSKTSALGRRLMSQVQLDPEIDKLIATIGFDPRRDITEIVAASTGPGSGLILGRGVFQPSRIAGLAGLAGANLTNYRGFDLVGANAAGPGGVLAFLDASVVALGDPSAVRAAIDRKLDGPAFSGVMAQKAQDISRSTSAWIVSSMPAGILPLAGGPATGFDPARNALQSILQLSGSLTLGTSNIVFTGEALAPSVQDAQAITDVLKFVLTMAQQNGAAPAASSKLLNSAQYSADGAVVRFSLSLPEQDVEQLLAPANSKQQPGLVIHH